VRSGPGAQSGVAAGFYYSILFFLGTLAVGVVFVVGLIVRAARASGAGGEEEIEP
jgi:hypothetical protein